MGDQNGERVVPESIDGPSATPPEKIDGLSAAPLQPPATQAQALATQALVTPNIDVDAEERVVHAYKEIANLQDINLHYPIHKLALQDWRRRQEYLSTSISRREGQSYELTNQIYSIFGWFAVFQGVVLTAVSQLTQTADTELGGVPVCGKIWSPIVLTGFATVATIVGIWQKFTSLQSLEKTIHKEKQAEIELTKRATHLLRDGRQGFKFHLNTDNISEVTNPKFVKNRIWVIVFVLIFTCICILFYFVILCDTWVVRKWDGGLHG